MAVGGFEDICANVFSSGARGPANPAFANKNFGMGLATTPDEGRSLRTNPAGMSRAETNRIETSRTGAALDLVFIGRKRTWS